jgi:carbamoyltransferase
MVVLGLGFTDHEASAALVVNGRLATAIARERISRLKKDGIVFGSGKLDLGPAIRYCLEENRLQWGDIDLIVWNHIDHIAGSTLADLLAREGAGFQETPTLALPHHFAHACAAFYLSPFSAAAVLVADGTGGSLRGLLDHCGGPEPDQLRTGNVPMQNFLTEDADTAQELESFYYCDGTQWFTLRKVFGRFGGIGARYGAVSSLLFADPLDAGKTMGLAHYGNAAQTFVFLQPEGPDDMPAWGAVRDESWAAIKQRLDLWRTGSLLRHGALNYEDKLPADCAAVIQQESEEAMLGYAAWIRRKTGSLNLCIGGGVALNCVANSRVARESGFDEVFVPPAPGDDGIAVGCALYGASLHGLTRQPCTAFLGRSYEVNTEAICATGLRSLGTVPDVAEWVAAVIDSGAVIGWYQGGAEVGPRALGHRSFLADPRHAGMRDHLNIVVKNRERFRPFAPVVREERVLDYFEELYPSYFMSFIATVRPERRGEVPAITHVDGTARYQVLRRSHNPELYAVVEAFERRTGVPLLLNTSFNRAGEPIVETPEQAARCIIASGADYLVMDGHIWANPAPTSCPGMRP